MDELRIVKIEEGEIDEYIGVEWQKGEEGDDLREGEMTALKEETILRKRVD